MPSGTSRHQPTSDTESGKTALVRHVGSGHHVHISDLGKQLHIAEAINQLDRDIATADAIGKLDPERFPMANYNVIVAFTDGSEADGKASSAVVGYQALCLLPKVVLRQHVFDRLDFPRRLT